jgi:hypothetical protein
LPTSIVYSLSLQRRGPLSVCYHLFIPLPIGVVSYLELFEQSCFKHCVQVSL